MRHECPYGEKCHFAKVNGGDWDFEPAKKHYHVWTFPQGPSVMALSIVVAGVEPKTGDDLLDGVFDENLSP